MTGHLFTGYFLTDGIKATWEWRTRIASNRTLPKGALHVMTLGRIK